MANSPEGPSGGKEKPEGEVVGLTREIDQILQEGGSSKEIEEKLKAIKLRKFRQGDFTESPLLEELLRLPSPDTPKGVAASELYLYARNSPLLTDEARKRIDKAFLYNPILLRATIERMKKNIRPDLRIVEDGGDKVEEGGDKSE